MGNELERTRKTTGWLESMRLAAWAELDRRIWEHQEYRRAVAMMRREEAQRDEVSQ